MKWFTWEACKSTTKTHGAKCQETEIIGVSKARRQDLWERSLIEDDESGVCVLGEIPCLPDGHDGFLDWMRYPKSSHQVCSVGNAEGVMEVERDQDGRLLLT